MDGAGRERVGSAIGLLAVLTHTEPIALYAMHGWHSAIAAVSAKTVLLPISTQYLTFSV